MNSDALLATFGRLHLVFVHFPVALLVLAAALELLELRRASETRAALIRVLVRAGAVGALLSALSGWIHAEEEPLGRTVAETLDLHRWSGVACALLAVLASLGRGVLRRVALWAATLAACAAGHFGGELVHGEGYLTELLTAAEPASSGSTNSGPAADPALEPTFERDVLGVMQARCVECHGPLKQKGDLRLDRLEPAWFEPGEFGTLIVRGDPAASELLRRMKLPLEDEDHMPPSKKPQPSAAELELVERWISAGAR